MFLVTISYLKVLDNWFFIFVIEITNITKGWNHDFVNNKFFPTEIKFLLVFYFRWTVIEPCATRTYEQFDALESMYSKLLLSKKDKDNGDTSRLYCLVTQLSAHSSPLLKLKLQVQCVCQSSGEGRASYPCTTQTAREVASWPFVYFRETFSIGSCWQLCTLGRG